MLRPWATTIAGKMLAEVDARDRESWRALGGALSVGLRREIYGAPTGEALQDLLEQQVTLITSIPIEAGQRVHELTLKGLEDSTRYSEYVEEIKRSGEVAEARAVCIARTETARTASTLTRVRAQAAGSTAYTWETVHDGSVRPGHKAMQGKTCEWDDPPEVIEGGRIMKFHPGTIWNCRCWPRPIIDLSRGRWSRR